MPQFVTLFASLLALVCSVTTTNAPLVADEPAGDAAVLSKTRGAMILHSSFDGVVDLNLFDENGSMYTAASTKRENSQRGTHGEVTIAKDQGKFGDALQFRRKTEQVVFYQGSESGYQQKDWQGTVSIWM